jgi:hypothetical protein
LKVAEFRLKSKYIPNIIHTLVVRPLGGLNDVLCQIEFARRVCVKTRRQFAIQTETGSKDLTHRFGQSFDSIFEFIDGTAYIPRKDLANLLLASGSVFPEYYGSPGRLLEGSLADISNGQHTRYQIAPRGHENFEVIVHESWGGGRLGMRLIGRIALTEEFSSRVFGAINELPKNATGVHFRNSDYRSDLKALNNLVRTAGKVGPIVIATDDDSVLEFLRVENSSREIYSASDLIGRDSKFSIIEMALAQLVVLALCNNLILVPLEKGQSARFSGYGLLAKSIWATRKLNTEGILALVWSNIRFFSPRSLFLLNNLSRWVRINFWWDPLARFVFILGQARNPKGLYRQAIAFYLQRLISR